MLPTLKTPQEFIDYYWLEFKDFMNLKNLQVSKVGFIGFFLNILGMNQSDIKQYYDHLFKEAFPITTQLLQNLYYHSALYGFIPPLATPASLIGNFHFNLNILPPTAATVIKREIYFSTTESSLGTLSNVELSIDNLLYILLSNYSITCIGTHYICNIKKENNQNEYINFVATNPRVPIIDLKQLEVFEFQLSIPNYEFGSFYMERVTIERGYIYQLEVIIKDNALENTEGVTYSVEYIKNFTDAKSETVFMKQFNDEILLEFGSGIQGKYVGGKTAVIRLYTTNGEEGNIGSGIYKPSEGFISVVDTHSNGSINDVGTYNISEFLNIEVDYGDGGADLFNVEELRYELINYIRARLNLVSDRDFHEVFKKYISGFELLFKKTEVMNNNIYLHTLFKDKYMVPFYTDCITIDQTEMDSMSFISYGNKLVKYILYPKFENDTLISPFLYLYDDLLNIYHGYLFYDLYSQHFNKIEVQQNGLLQIPASFSFEFIEEGNPKIRIIFTSYQAIGDLKFKISCTQLNIKDIYMVVDSDNNRAYIDVNLFIMSIDVIIDMLDYNGDLQCIYEINNVTPIVDYSEYLNIKKYKPEYPNIHYYLNIPVINIEHFNSYKTFILNNIGSLITSVFGNNNQMISDDIQIKFLNTYIISASDLQLMTLQEYNFNLQLPLKIRINIYISKKIFIFNQTINISEEVETLRLEIAEILNETYTGILISFYETQVIDFIHNKDWVKHCEIFVTDTNSVAIPDNNIETRENNDVLDLMDKFEGVKYTPPYWYWNLNDIEINTVVEE